MKRFKVWLARLDTAVCEAILTQLRVMFAE
jgi:hypothetical protein